LKKTVEELLGIIDSFNEKISALSENEFHAKPLPEKWSKKEVLGHLIDSAQNNLRRFIVGQYETTPANIIYEQDFWVSANGYQQMKKEEILSLWKLTNHRIAAVLSNMPASNYTKTVNTGKNEVSLRSLEWLAADYVKHMKHHLNQIIPNSYDIVYP
jgi:hypothetical protein